MKLHQPMQRGCTLQEKARTLDYINRIRAACGSNQLDSLPEGTVRSSSDCSIARALNELSQTVLVFQDVIQVDDLEFARIIAEEFDLAQYKVDSAQDNLYNVPLPKIMQVFVENFDEGLYEDLVAAAV